MRLVETLLVRDEVDVIEAHLVFHLDAGVDLVIATDHESRDGTRDVLERFARAGHVRVLREQGPMREAEWRTRMARLAALEHGADWVFNADADQFWWPRGGDLKEMLLAAPGRFDAVHAFDRVFVPRPEDGAHFAERMIHRLSSGAPVNAPASTYRPLARVIHRGLPTVSVSLGNHSVAGLPGGAVPHWHPVEVLHFPWRSPEQMARKSRHFVQAGLRHATTYHTEAHRAVTEERAQEHYQALAVDDKTLEFGYTEHVIVADTRVRDRLRTLSRRAELTSGGHELAVREEPRKPRELDRISAGDVTYAIEAAILREASLVRASRLVDRLEQQTQMLERQLVASSERPGDGSGVSRS